MLATPLRARLGNHRLLPAAAGLALAAVLLVPSGAAANPGASATLSGSTLNAAVTGNARVGVWRVRIVAPSGRERIDFVLRTGDIAWHGAVRVSQLRNGRWTLVSRRALDGSMRRLEQASGRGAGVRWNSASFRLPRNGDARFEVNVELTRKGSYRIVGAVRVASEAFTYGPWKTVGRVSVSR